MWRTYEPYRAGGCLFSSFPVLQNFVIWHRMESKERTTLESMTAQVSVNFQDALPGSVHAGDYNQFLLAKLLTPPT
jgi:hypothetical protein